MNITKEVYSRVALVGNPSDGFGGKTIALPIKNFSAKVTLKPSEKIRFKPNSQDQLQLDNLASLAKDVQQHGYYGGIRLLKASVKKFYDFCQENKLRLPAKNFSIEYQTTIPRQMGLGGSSAIIIASLKALIDFYQIPEGKIPNPILADLALSVETEELDISAGLQDRVVQSFNCPIYMDFSDKAFAENQGKCGIYRPLSKDCLPPLFLIYSNASSESGKIHNRVGYRFKKGERLVVGGMKKLASLTDQALIAFKKKDFDQLAKIFNRNFDIRRKIYGDQVIGDENLKMIDLPRQMGLCSKFSGSGGAIVGIWQKKSEFDKLRRACQKAGFKIRKIKVW